MRIDSRLMKTDIELASIERQEDRLLMKSPPTDWNGTKVYLSPRDVVNTLKLSAHRGMIAYVLLFPFFLVSDYLRREKDVRPIVYDIGYFLSAVFMGLLLIGGASFLRTQPLTGTIVLGVLAGMFLLVTAGSGKTGFLYLAVPLTVLAYFLLAFGQGIPFQEFPRLALGVVLTLLVLGRALGNVQQGRLAGPLFRTATLVVIVFVAFIAFNARGYALDDPWGAGLPVLAFALFHFVRYLDSREVLQHYAAMLLLGGGFLFVLYGIPLLPSPYYGLPLIGLSMAMTLVADRYHESHGLAHVAPVYSVAILIALAAFAYAPRDLSALLLSLALFSIHFFGGTRSLGIKSTAENPGEKTFQWIEFAMANVAAGAAALLMLTLGRANWASIVAGAAYVYFYQKMGFGREPTSLQTRNQYLWAAGAFYGVLVFVVLGLLDPLGTVQNDMLLVPPLLLPLLIFGRRVQRRGMAGAASSIYESVLPSIVAAIALPVILGDPWLPTASAVDGVLVALFLVLGLWWRDEGLFYPIPILAAHLYSNGLTVLGLSAPQTGPLFLPPALLAMAIALLLHRRGAGPARTLFLTWFVFSAASVLATAPDRTLTVYLVAGWSVLYLFAAATAIRSEDRQSVAEVAGGV